MVKEGLSRRIFLQKASLAPVLAVIPNARGDLESSNKPPTFDNALDELRYVCENTRGCAPPTISYDLMKRAIDEGVGEISEGGERNMREDKKYRHLLLSEQLGIFFYCYTDRKVNKAGSFV